MFNTRRDYKLTFLSIFIAISLLTGTGCAQSTQTIAGVISKLQPSPEDGISVDVALNIATASYVCILSPYTSRVEPNTDSASDVNTLLSNQNYLGDEGHWTLIYGAPGQWTLEKIRRQKIELVQLRTSKGKKIDSICGLANAIQLNKLSDGKVNFIKKEAK